MSSTLDREWLHLSLAQQSVWLDTKTSDPSSCQLGGWARIRLEVDQEVLRQSISLLMARHEALRLHVDALSPRQWLDGSTAAPLSVVFAGETPDPDASFQQYIDTAFAEPMPLGDHPLFRIDLVTYGRGVCFVLWRFHHLIADSLSVAVTLRLWTNIYMALVSDDPVELAPPSFYRSVIDSDQDYLSSPAYRQDLEYWTSRLTPLPEQLLSENHPGAAVRAKAIVLGWPVGPDLLAQLHKVTGDLGLTVQRVLFALFSITLALRYGKIDVVSGLALHRRDWSNAESLGMLAGVIAIRSTIDRSVSLAQSIQTYSQQVDADLRHQRMPADRLAQALDLFRHRRTRLFEATVSYLAADRMQGDSLVEGLRIQTGFVPTREASPISFHVTELPGSAGLVVHIATNPDFLPQNESQSLMSLFQLIFDRLLAAPDTTVESLGGLIPMGKESPEPLVVSDETEEWFPLD